MNSEVVNSINEDQQCLIVLNAAPGLEDVLVDWLLSRENGTGFTTFPASGHTSAHDSFTAGEQVRGRKRQVQFQIQLPLADVSSFLTDIRAQFVGADLHYWVVPVIAGGHLMND